MYVTQGQSSYIDSCISTTNSTNIWIPKTCLTFSGTGSVSSGSAKSVSTQRSELDESFSSSASFPNSPATAAGQQPKVSRPPVSINGVALQRQRQRDIYRKDFLSLSASTAASYHFRSRSQEALAPSVKTIPVKWTYFWTGIALQQYKWRRTYKIKQNVTVNLLLKMLFWYGFSGQVAKQMWM